MKKSLIFIFLLLTLSPSVALAQNVDIRINPSTIKPDSRARMHVTIVCSEKINTSTISPSSLRLGSAPPDVCEFGTTEPNVCPNLHCLFSITSIGLTCDDKEVSLTGALVSGEKILGKTGVRMVSCSR
jgi:hypothetical protein